MIMIQYQRMCNIHNNFTLNIPLQNERNLLYPQTPFLLIVLQLKPKSFNTNILLYLFIQLTDHLESNIRMLHPRYHINANFVLLNNLQTPLFHPLGLFIIRQETVQIVLVSDALVHSVLVEKTKYVQVGVETDDYFPVECAQYGKTSQVLCLEMSYGTYEAFHSVDTQEIVILLLPSMRKIELFIR